MNLPLSPKNDFIFFFADYNPMLFAMFGNIIDILIKLQYLKIFSEFYCPTHLFVRQKMHKFFALICFCGKL